MSARAADGVRPRTCLEEPRLRIQRAPARVPTAPMTDQQDRNEESAATDETKYERELSEEERRRHEAAERLRNDPLPEPDDGA